MASSLFSSMIYQQEYKEGDKNKNIDLLSQRDLSLNSIHSSLPNYTSYHLNYCLDNCSDDDLTNFIKYKAEHDIKTFKIWMRIIASNITPQIEEENIIINEWYNHLNINNINNENKETEIENESGSEEEEHYSISAISTTSIKNISDINNKNKKIEISIIISNLLDLPSSWLLHLFSNYFNFNTLLTKLPLVCHKFRTLCGDPNVWKSIKLPITVIRNIYNTNNNIKDNDYLLMDYNKDKDKDKEKDKEKDNNITSKRENLSIYNINFLRKKNTLYFISFLIRSCRLLQSITFEGSIEENDWNAWNHTMKILGNHALRQIKWNNKDKNTKINNIYQYFKYKNDYYYNKDIIDTLFVRCRHISRRGYCWLQSLTYIPTIEHIHCAALSRSDDVQNMIYNFNNLKTLNVNILGPRHPNRNFHAHHRLALKSISHLIPSSVTEFAIPVSVQEDFVKECFSRMPLLENLDFFRLTTPHQNVDIDSWACCLSSDTIYHLANNCKNLKKCQLFVKCFKPKTQIWDSVKYLLQQCKGIHMLTIGMTEYETLNGLNEILPNHSNIGGAGGGAGGGVDDDEDEYDILSKRYFDQLKKVPFLRKRFRKFKKKTMKFPKFTIMWCLLT